MKKNSKAKVRDYESYNAETFEYYGVLMKNGRIRIDTKRYKKFFDIPNKKIEHRFSQYYMPSKVHRSDYFCNMFYDAMEELKKLWKNEFVVALKALKTPSERECEAILAYGSDGILENDEVYMVANFEKNKRMAEYSYVKKAIFAQFLQTIMSRTDATLLKILVANGYKEGDYTREKADSFIQGCQKKENSKSWMEFTNYNIYNKLYLLWNFIKHNSKKAFNNLKKCYPDCLMDIKSTFENGDNCLNFIRISEETIMYALNNLPKFVDEVCEVAFGENVKDSKWDYDDYFINRAKDEIEMIQNPLGIPWYL